MDATKPTGKAVNHITEEGRLELAKNRIACSFKRSSRHVSRALGMSQTAASAVQPANENSNSQEPLAPPRINAAALRPLLIAALGGLLAGVLLSSITHGIGSAAAPTLEAVSQNEIENAVGSMDLDTAGDAIGNARRCEAPLGFVTVSAQPSAPLAFIRIRSGNYLSPPLQITPSPQRVAVPFPAPYPTGNGVISVEGTARDLNVWLTPGLRTASLNGVWQINVFWTPKKPC
jgi:hypothetical protein